MHKKARFLIGCVAAMLCALPSTSMAQQGCAPHENVREGLEKTFGETLAGVGIINQTTILELYMNEETGTFTVVRSIAANGKIISCPLAGGGDYIPVSPKPKGDPA